MERERKNVTIKDVAKRAGVAISTVSRVLNGLDKVSEKTQKKVRDAVEELGYVQNALAVSMVTGQTKTILMAVPDFTNDFNAAVIQGAEEALKARGYTMLIISTKDYTEEDYQLLHRRFSALVDGVLVIPSNPDVMDYTLWEKPLVQIDCYRPQGDCYTVEIENARGAYLLTEALIKKGHRRIGFVGGIPGQNLGGRRIAGYRRALLEYKIPSDEFLVMYGYHFEETGYKGMNRLLDLPPGLRPTGVVAVNNLTCIGCIRALEERGLHAGRDISLAGFDDHLLARYSTPGITVIDRPTLGMGKKGAELLLKLLRGEQVEKRNIMEISLIERESILPVGKQ